MCNITRDIVLRANERCIMRGKRGRREGMPHSASPDSIRVSVTVHGRVIEREISMEKIKDAFGKAWMKHGKKL